MKPRSIIASLLMLAIGLVSGPAVAAAEESDALFAQPSVPAVDVEGLRVLAAEDAPELLEELFLRQILRTAPPAPMLHKDAGTESDSPTNRAVVAFDVATGQESTFTQAQPFDLDDSNKTGSFAPFAAPDPVPIQGSLGGDSGEPLVETDLESPEAIVPTPPGPVTNTIPFPWRTVVKLLMRFQVSGTNYYYLCSGATVGSFMVWTAGHCVFNHDPNDDGSTADAQWANEIWIWPAQTESIYINGLGVDFAEDWPYGEAKATNLISYSGWTSSGDITWDFGWISLNQRSGTRVGWMGHEWGVERASLNFNGYPAETPYVPAGEMRQYPGWDASNVVSYADRRISMDAYTYGGHSGGPVWYFDGSNRYIQGVNSTSNRTGSAYAERVTSGIHTITVDAQTADETNIPPVARPELIEYLHSTTAKDLITNSVIKGGTIQVEYNVYNVGFAPTVATLDFYLSTNNFISTGDRPIGSHAISLPANNYANSTTTFTVPLSVPAGTYYVGWIMSSSVAEYKSGDWAVIGPETLTVSNPPVDLHVPGLTISQSDLCTNQPFGIDATVRNQGGTASAPTTLRYYRSSTATISFSDTQLATDAVAALGPGSVVVESATVNTASADGLWWVGACIDSVVGEVVMSNQCFTPGRMIEVIPGTLTVSSHIYPIGVTSLKAGHWISAGGGVVCPTGCILNYEAERLVLDNGFTVDSGGTFTAINTPPPVGCP